MNTSSSAWLPKAKGVAICFITNRDEKYRAGCKAVLERLIGMRARDGTTLVLVTHDPELAAVADEVIALRDGRVVSRTEEP